MRIAASSLWPGVWRATALQLSFALLLVLPVASRQGASDSQTKAAKTKNDDRVRGIQPESPRPIVFQVAPSYPAIAASLKLIGTVQLQVIVKADGTVREIHVLGGHPLLAAAAVEALKQWKYQSTTKETIESVRISFGP